MNERSGTLELEQISVVFRNKKQTVDAVRDVNITIPTGTVFGLIGYSGAGKSTLARTINLLQRPSSGSVKIDGVDITTLGQRELRQWRRKIGMIFQHFNLMATRTVEENVMLPLLHSGLSKQEKRQKADRLLKLVDLADRKDAYPNQLSGGQKQRVAIARALANDPQILISDEATSALDPKTTQNILHLLKRLNEQLGLTIILITHEMEVVREITNQVAVMDHGRIVEQGPTTQLFLNPQQPLTRELLVDGDQGADEMATLIKQYTAADCSLVSFTYREQQTDLFTLLKTIEQWVEKIKLVYNNTQRVENQLWGTAVIAVRDDEVANLQQHVAAHPAVVANKLLKEVD